MKGILDLIAIVVVMAMLALVLAGVYVLVRWALTPEVAAVVVGLCFAAYCWFVWRTA